MGFLAFDEPDAWVLFECLEGFLLSEACYCTISRFTSGCAIAGSVSMPLLWAAKALRNMNGCFVFWLPGGLVSVAIVGGNFRLYVGFHFRFEFIPVETPAPVVFGGAGCVHSLSCTEFKYVLHG